MKKTRVMFIVPPYLLDVASMETTRKIRSFTAFPYGILSIVTYLKNMIGINIDIEIVDMNIYENPIDILKERITIFSPEIIGFSLMFDNSYHQLKEISDIIKLLCNNVKIVVGGQVTNASYTDILEEISSIDAICYKEGEIPMYDLVISDNKQLTLETHKSWITRGSLILKQYPQESIVDLNKVVDIVYEYTDVEKYSMEESFSPFANKKDKRKQFFLVSSRGCPFKCSFCMNSKNEKHSMRYASIDKIMDHLHRLKDQYNMNGITIYDDQILFNQRRAKELFSKLATLDVRIECPNGVSVAYIDKELAILMKEAGMDSIYLAIESGSPFVLKRLMNKPLKVEQCFRVVEFLREENFWIQGFFVNGMPGESSKHRKETMKFIKKLGLDWSSFSLASPIRGTRLYDECINKGYISKVNIGEYDMSIYNIKVPDIPPEKVTKETYLMNLEANFVNNYRLGVGQPELAMSAFKYILDRHPKHAFAHYFYAKSIEQIYPTRDIIEKHIEIARQIKEEVPVWSEYFDHFGISI